MTSEQIWEYAKYIKIGHYVETTYGTFKIVDVTKMINGITLKEEVLIVIDYNGLQRLVPHEYITKFKKTP